MREKFVTKKYRYDYGYLYDLQTNERVILKLQEIISGIGYCFVTIYEGKVIRQAFVDENGKQFFY